MVELGITAEKMAGTLRLLRDDYDRTEDADIRRGIDYAIIRISHLYNANDGFIGCKQFQRLCRS
jgi:hypothetical protein